MLADIGLTPVEIAGRISAALAARDADAGPGAPGNGHKESGA